MVSPELISVLDAIDSSPIYLPILFFYGFYPIAMSGVWIIMSVSYFRRRERGAPPAPTDFAPFVSIVVPAYGEEDTIGPTLDALLRVDYPDFEIIVVSDGSPDGTVDVVRNYLSTGKVRLLDKRVNEGKAMALNDALPLCRGEIVVTLDADIIVTPGVLRALVPHFLSPRVAAVTGNPRVSNRGSLLRNLQTLEFTSIVSVQRRAQRVWGRVLTVSGAITAFRRTALLDVGQFSPDMATEDIEMTWKLQRSFWDVRYEASAVVWMQVPPTLRELWKQRRRWARGLTQVLLKHRGVTVKWVYRRLWPVYYEGVLSILWAYCFVLVTTYWGISWMAGFTPYGSSPIPNLWGMAIATACLLQILTGVLLDRRYDPTVMRYYPLAILYPLIYWTLMSTITSIYTVDALFRKRPRLQTWNIQRAR
jgi:poly-beta-1,6-N-acetyl-D-glucosamine synthase